MVGAVAADDALTLGTVVVTVLVIFGWLVGPTHRIRTAKRRRHTTRWYELVPLANREPLVERLEPGMAAWVNSLRSRAGNPLRGYLDRIRNHQPGAVIHRIKERGSLRTYVGIYDAANPDAVVSGLADTIGGEAVPCESPDVPDGARVMGRRSGFDPLDFTVVEEAHRLADVLANRINEDRAFSVVIEPSVPWEMKRLRAFLHVEEQAAAGAIGSMGTLGPATARQTSDRMVRMMVVGTGEDTATAQELVLGFGGHLDQFVQAVRSENPSDVNRAMVSALFLLPVAALWWQVGNNVPVAVAVAATTLLALVLAATGVVNLTRAELDIALRRGLLIPQTPQWFNPRWITSGFLRATFRDRNAAVEGRQRAGRVAHPHPRRLFVASPRQLVGLTAFPSEMSTAVTAAGTNDRNAPHAVTVPSGVRVGIDPTGIAVWLPESDRQWGVFAVGDPGTGKTTWLMNLYWSDLINRKVAQHQSRIPKSVIWIETKGEGAQRALNLARNAYYGPNDIAYLPAAATTGPRLDLIDWSDPNRGATLLVEMMRYAFDQGDIREQAAGVLHAAFRLAIACPPDISQQLGFKGPRPNVIRVAFWLLGGEPHSGLPDKTINLFQQAAARDTITAGVPAPTSSGFAGDFAEVTSPDTTPMVRGPLADAWEEFARYLPPYMTKRESQQITESSRNKLQFLLAAPSMWEPDPQRPEVTMLSLIQGGWPAVLNFGPPGGDDSPGFTSLLAQRLAAMGMYALWNTIKYACDGWQAQGRAIAIYSDELKDIAGTGTGGDVIRELADQGRSRGVQPVFATQRPTQLPELTRESVQSFGTRVYFRLEEIDTAEAAANDLSGGRRGGFTGPEIRDLPPLTGACRMRRDGAAQAPFTIKAIPDNWLDPKTWDATHPPHPWAGDAT